MNILAMDTSAKVSTVAVCGESGILSEFSVNTRLTHSQTIMPMCDSMLKCAHLALEEIDAFAVAAGPGSFTGLRIGIAAVKGLAQGLHKPCIPVSTLEGLGENLRGFDGIACAVMDARCAQVYNALFSLENGEVNRLCGDRALSIESLMGELLENHAEKKIYLVGDGAELCYTQMKDRVQQLFLAPEGLRYQRAGSIALCARRKTEGSIPPDELMPVYLRLPQAERMLLAKQEAEKK